MDNSAKHKSKNKNNKHAQKWNVENTNAFIQSVYNYAVENEKCRSMATACSACGGYEDLMTYFKTLDFAESIDFRPIKECHELFKGRLIEQGLDNKANATMAIFVLKNNHGMSDKVEQKTELNVKEFDITKVVNFKND